MKSWIVKARNKLTLPLIFLFVPLEILPFLCETDSPLGKALLVVKFMLIFAIYLLHIDQITFDKHVVLFVSCASMCVTTLSKGGAGVFMLIAIMLMSIIVFPHVAISHSMKKWLWGAMAFGALAAILSGFLTNLNNGIPFFDMHESTLNSNTYGMLIISIFFYIVSFLPTVVNRKRNQYIIITALTALCFLAVLQSRCRSALLTLIVFSVVFVFHQYSNSKVTRYIICIGSFLFSFICLLFMEYISKHAESEVLELLSIKAFDQYIFSGRESIWKAALYGFCENPLFGNGGDFLAEFTDFTSAHNVLMGILVCMGVIPTISYIWIMLDPKAYTINGKTEEKKLLPYNVVCYIACITLTAFECSFTDSRLNFLFLPLLIGACVESNELTCDSGEQLETYQGKKEKNWLFRIFGEYRFVSLWLVPALALFVLFLVCPHLLQTQINDLDYDVASMVKQESNINENLLMNCSVGSLVDNNVIWEYNGKGFKVQGNSTDASSLYYYKAEEMPSWLQKGLKYEVTFSSSKIQFIVYCYKETKGKVLLNTMEDGVFTIPEDARGMIIRLYVAPGQTVSEYVEPQISLLTD